VENLAITARRSELRDTLNAYEAAFNVVRYPLRIEDPVHVAQLQQIATNPAIPAHRLDLPLCLALVGFWAHRPARVGPAMSDVQQGRH
jgi:hypothetical protein